jgi:hypothetical protein
MDITIECDVQCVFIDEKRIGYIGSRLKSKKTVTRPEKKIRNPHKTIFLKKRAILNLCYTNSIKISKKKKIQK